MSIKGWNLEVRFDDGRVSGWMSLNPINGRFYVSQHHQNAYRFVSLPDAEIERDQWNDFWHAKDNPLRASIVEASK